MSSENTSFAPKNPHRAFGPALEKEKAARAALEACAGGALSDPEWNRAQARLLEFASILRRWGQDVSSKESKLPKAA
jgi:hypothetical protein